MKTNFPLILAWIRILIAAVGGCGWRDVERGENSNFNWDRHTLEVKTEEISSLIRGGKQLEIVFDSVKQTGPKVLKIWKFFLTKDSEDGDATEVLNCHITFHEEQKHIQFSEFPLGKLRWIFKKMKTLKSIGVELAGGNTLSGKKIYFPIPDEDRTEMFRFGSADNISLSYRVNSIDGDDDCVKPGNKTSCYDDYSKTCFQLFLC